MSEVRFGGQPPAELVPENAPFDEEQRAWLNGFFAGLLGLASSASRAPAEAPPTASAPMAPRERGPSWGDPEASLERRSQLSEGEDLKRLRGRASLGGAARAAASSEASARHGPSAMEGALPRQGERRLTLRCRVKSERKLTLAEAGSEIHEVILEPTEGEIHYRAGDCLAVFPHNDPDLVRALLRAVGARGQEIVVSRRGPCEVWRCLLEELDISQVPRETLELFARQAVDVDERRASQQLLAEGHPRGLDLLDLIAMFPSVRPSIDQIVPTLSPLEPRLYAIASSPSVYPREVHLAVRMLRVERAGRERKGVASHFLADGVFRGDDLEAQLHPADRFVLPEDRKGPMIMLGSGTGVARYRAFLQELEARGHRGNTWLILASCFEGDEALYEAELRAWSSLGVLEHLDVIKRGQRGRHAGPQDVLKKRARRVVSWLDRGAAVYACGEGKALSAVLSDALMEVLGRQGKMKQTEAADFIQVMRREGRYVEEVY